jgi:hypothetical protein
MKLLGGFKETLALASIVVLVAYMLVESKVKNYFTGRV